MRVTPSIDIGRIASGVVVATAHPSRPQLVTSAGRGAPARQSAGRRWVGWKAAAAITIAAAGIGSFAVWRSTDDATPLPNVRSATVAVAPAAQPVEELGIAGGLGDLSSGDLQTLLGDLGRSAVAADASFEEPAVVVPEVGTVTGWESL